MTAREEKRQAWWAREQAKEKRCPSKLDLVHEGAVTATGAPAVCFRCGRFLERPGAEQVGTCAERPDEPQFRYGVCLGWTVF